MGVVRDIVTRFRFLSDRAGLSRVQAQTKAMTREMRRQAWQARQARRAFRQLSAQIRSYVAAYLGFRTLKALTVDLAQEISDLTTTAGLLGVTPRQLDALRFAFEALTIDASKADAMLRYLVQGIADAQRGTGLASDALRELGLRAQELGRLTPAEQLNVVVNRLREIPDASKRMMIAQSIAGRRGGYFLNRLVTAWGTVSKATKDAERQGILFGKSYKSFDKMAVRLALIRRQWRDLKIQLGETIVRTLLPLLKGLNRWLADPKHRKQLVQWVKNLATAFAVLAALKIPGWLIRIARAIKGAILLVLPKAIRVLGWMRAGIAAIGGAASALLAVIVTVWGAIVYQFVSGRWKLQEVWDGIKLALHDLGQWFARIWDAIVAKVQAAVNRIKALVREAVDWIRSLPRRAWEGIKGAGKALAGAIGLGGGGGGGMIRSAPLVLPKVPVVAADRSVRVGQVTVQIVGGTEMGPREVRRAVQSGMTTGLGRVVATAGGE